MLIIKGSVNFEVSLGNKFWDPIGYTQRTKKKGETGEDFNSFLHSDNSIGMFSNFDSKMITLQLYIYKKRSHFSSIIVLYIPITLSKYFQIFRTKWSLYSCISKKRSYFPSFIVLYILITLSECFHILKNKMVTVKLHIDTKEAILLVS